MLIVLISFCKINFLIFLDGIKLQCKFNAKLDPDFLFISIVRLFVLDYNALYFKVWNCKKTLFFKTKNSINGIPIVLTPDYKLDKSILFLFSITLKLPTYLHKRWTQHPDMI